MQATYAQKNYTEQKASANTAESVVDFSSQSATLQRHTSLADGVSQRAPKPRPNLTGMPDNLKSGIESLSGFSMDDVRVHYNSSKPAAVQALAYTQGTDIHVAPGQEKHLPHEAWHVAQQMAGRVSPTTNINGMPVNDNAGLEHEADVMGEKAETQRKTDNRNICETTSDSLNYVCLKKKKDPVIQAKKYDIKYNLTLDQQSNDLQDKENLVNDSLKMRHPVEKDLFLRNLGNVEDFFPWKLDLIDFFSKKGELLKDLLKKEPALIVNDYLNSSTWYANFLENKISFFKKILKDYIGEKQSDNFIRRLENERKPPLHPYIIQLINLLTERKIKPHEWQGLKDDNETFFKNFINDTRIVKDEILLQLVALLNQSRGPGYETAKRGFKPDSKVYTPHISTIGLGDRPRTNTFVNDIKSYLVKNEDYVGGHLIKCEWGGEDNMMNVVVWSNTAEEKWSKGFEKEIEAAFLLDKKKQITIEIVATKEDNWSESPEGKLEIGSNKITKYKKMMMDKNMERIPYKVEAKAFDLKNVGVTIGISESGYKNAIDVNSCKKEPLSGKKGMNKIKGLLNIFNQESVTVESCVKRLSKLEALGENEKKEGDKGLITFLTKKINETSVDKKNEKLIKEKKINITISELKDYITQTDASGKNTCKDFSVDGMNVLLYFIEKNKRMQERQDICDKLYKERCKAVFHNCLNLGINPLYVIKKENKDLLFKNGTSTNIESEYLKYCKEKITQIIDQIKNPDLQKFKKDLENLDINEIHGLYKKIWDFLYHNKIKVGNPPKITSK